MEWDQCVEHFNKDYTKVADYYSMIADSDDSDARYYALWMQARAARESGVSFDEYKNLYMDAFELYPHRAEVLYELGQHCTTQSQACEIYKLGMYLPVPSNSHTFVDNSVYEWKLLDKYIIDSYHARMFQESYDAWVLLKNRGTVPEWYTPQFLQNGEYAKKELNSSTSLRSFITDISHCRNAIAKGGVPNIIHIMWVKGYRVYSMIQYLTIKIAYEVQRPLKIYVYNDEEPVNNEWWERSRQYIEIVHVNPPRSVNGRNIPYAQHIADVMRVCIMYEKGGIYLDSDLFLTKPLEDVLHSSKVTLCRESETKIWNGFLAAPPKHPFFERWIAEYETKYGTPEGGCWWAGLSVETPMRLYMQHDALASTGHPYVDLLDTEIFLPIGLHDDTIYKTYSEGMYQCSYAVHLFETEAEKRGVLPRNKQWVIDNPETYFSKQFGKYID